MVESDSFYHMTIHLLEIAAFSCARVILYHTDMISCHELHFIMFPKYVITSGQTISIHGVR